MSHVATANKNGQTNCFIINLPSQDSPMDRLCSRLIFANVGWPPSAVLQGFVPKNVPKHGRPRAAILRAPQRVAVKRDFDSLPEPKARCWLRGCCRLEPARTAGRTAD